MMDSLCWAFDATPNQMEDVMFEVSLRDIRSKLKLKVGYEHAIIAQHFQTLAYVVSRALGGGDKKKDRPPENFMEAAAQFQSVFGGR